MTRSAAGMLAALGAALASLVGLVHGDWTWIVLADGAAVTGLAAYLAGAPKEKSRWHLPKIK
jgi:hypothetical protein